MSNPTISRLETKEQSLLEAVAKGVAARERLDSDRDYNVKDRMRLKARADEGKTYDQAKLKQANDAIRQANDELTQVRKALKDRRGWLAATRQKLKSKRRQIRNAARPKLIDLHLDFRPMSTQGPVDKVIGHYTAGPVDRDTEDAIRLCRIYHQAHLNQGWSGEAYMICFTRDGDILLLRPAKWVGAHTLGHNTGSYGVVCHGTTGDTPSKAQKRAMQWWADHGHESQMGPARTSVRPGALKWFGHNDFNPTSCPGSFKSTYLKKGR